MVFQKNLPPGDSEINTTAILFWQGKLNWDDLIQIQRDETCGRTSSENEDVGFVNRILQRHVKFNYHVPPKSEDLSSIRLLVEILTSPAISYKYIIPSTVFGNRQFSYRFMIFC